MPVPLLGRDILVQQNRFVLPHNKAGDSFMSDEYAIERAWLLSASNFSLVRQCRRYIQEEFDVKLSLMDDAILRQIRFYAESSRNFNLRRCAQPIISMLIHECVPKIAISTSKDFERKLPRNLKLVSRAPKLYLVQ